jgi:hypothetical protein
MDTDTAFPTIALAAKDALNMFLHGPPEERANVSEEAVADALRAFQTGGLFESTGLDLDKPEDYAQARRMAVGQMLILWWLGEGDRKLTKPEKREEMMGWIEEMSDMPRKDWHLVGD